MELPWRRWRGPGGFWEVGNVVFLYLGGDYTGVHYIICTFLLCAFFCVDVYLRKRFKKNPKKTQLNGLITPHPTFYWACSNSSECGPSPPFRHAVYWMLFHRAKPCSQLVALGGGGVTPRNSWNVCSLTNIP